MALILTLVLSLLKLGSGQWQVIGPDKMVQVLVGEDAVFSCSLAPETSAEAMEVRFFRDQVSSVVHLYRNGKDQVKMQIPDYQGRTELLKDSMVEGHVSLRLEKVTLSDSGLYGCFFSSQSFEQEAFWDLQVSEPGSTPLISIVGYVDGGIQLFCQSSGWFLQPTLVWRGPQGHDLPSSSNVSKDMHGLFDVATSLTVQENAGSISCCIQLTDQGQKVESRIWIGETFFQPFPWNLVSQSLGVLFLVLYGIIIGLSIFFHKYNNWNIQAELDPRRKHGVEELRKARQYEADVTLNMDMARPQIYTSEIYRKKDPFLKKKFNTKIVVAPQSFQGGKHYWEVEVGHNEMWCLGVCLDMDRRVNEILSPYNGYWVLGLETEHEYFTFDPHRIILSLRFPPTRVGILLDYDGGTISFYNINDRSLICTLKNQFEGSLKPFILYGEKYKTPIVICPISRHQKKAHPQRNPTPIETENLEPSSQVKMPLLSGVGLSGKTSHTPLQDTGLSQKPEPCGSHQ
ncbi:butyrophilin-like protein 8 [Talpa occidentalis]|uniref:butyrophilin-like protein 8 n=1 Tax=Talpa occidentalis TaxID=50954 RepID=UPI00188F9187|nr:butyrophilin-like protein 8 [Talpa occidentalis]